MYVIVTTNKKLVEDAQKLGASVVKVPDKEVEKRYIYQSDEEKILKTLQVLEFRPHLKGYIYIKDILVECINKPNYQNEQITKIIYPRCAQKFGTQPNRVERAIRHSIEKSFSIAPEKYSEVFRRTISTRPTNDEFLGMLAEYIAN